MSAAQKKNSRKAETLDLDNESFTSTSSQVQPANVSSPIVTPEEETTPQTPQPMRSFRRRLGEPAVVSPHGRTVEVISVNAVLTLVTVGIVKHITLAYDFIAKNMIETHFRPVSRPYLTCPDMFQRTLRKGYELDSGCKADFFYPGLKFNVEQTTYGSKVHTLKTLWMNIYFEVDIDKLKQLIESFQPKLEEMQTTQVSDVSRQFKLVLHKQSYDATGTDYENFFNIISDEHSQKKVPEGGSVSEVHKAIKLEF